MKFPDKITAYKESILCLIPQVLDRLSVSDMTPMKLYSILNSDVSISDFIEVLDCLYVLGKVRLDQKYEVLHYVD